MTDEELIAALRSRTKKVLSKNWLVGRECPECGSEADRPKCMWDFGPSCPRLDPDNYSPPAWEYVPDKDCATAADRLKALTSENEKLRDAWQEYLEAAETLAELERCHDTTKRFDRALDKKYAAIEKARAALEKQP